MLQELATTRPPAERPRLVRHSVAKFRRAMRQRPEFDRACYNLGTVFYAHACQLQHASQQRLSSQLTQVGPPILAICLMSEAFDAVMFWCPLPGYHVASLLFGQNECTSLPTIRVLPKAPASGIALDCASLFRQELRAFHWPDLCC